MNREGPPGAVSLIISAVFLSSFFCVVLLSSLDLQLVVFHLFLIPPTSFQLFVLFVCWSLSGKSKKKSPTSNKLLALFFQCFRFHFFGFPFSFSIVLSVVILCVSSKKRGFCAVSAPLSFGWRTTEVATGNMSCPSFLAPHSVAESRTRRLGIRQCRWQHREAPSLIGLQLLSTNSDCQATGVYSLCEAHRHSRRPPQRFKVPLKSRRIGSPALFFAPQPNQVSKVGNLWSTEESG